MAENSIQVLQPSKKRRRLTVDFSNSLHKDVQALANDAGLQVSDVIREGAKLLVEMTKLKKLGYEQSMSRTAENGSIEKVRIIIGIDI